ncbi:unnamed protein product [marine sediment metagenome]|uniref:Uncharacterized protein n=1 Tax=marine sediment metagenome TaxID=412755 RepID=X0SIG5_9ZZZZ
MKFNNMVEELLEWAGPGAVWCGSRTGGGMPQSSTAGPSTDGPASNPDGTDLKEFIITKGKETKSFDTKEERDEFMADNYGWEPKEIKDGDDEIY